MKWSSVPAALGALRQRARIRIVANRTSIAPYGSEGTHGRPALRTKKKKDRWFIRKYWWLAPVLFGVTMVFWIATGPRWSRARITLPSAGQAHDGLCLRARRPCCRSTCDFYGKPLNNAESRAPVEQANERVAAKDYSNAVGMLEQVAKVAAVPVVFNNLGVLYAEAGRPLARHQRLPRSPGARHGLRSRYG